MGRRMITQDNTDYRQPVINYSKGQSTMNAIENPVFAPDYLRLIPAGFAVNDGVISVRWISPEGQTVSLVCMKDGRLARVISPRLSDGDQIIVTHVEDLENSPQSP